MLRTGHGTRNAAQADQKRTSTDGDAMQRAESVEDWVDLEYINEVIKTLGGRGHTRSLRMNYIIISLSKITGAISNLLDVLIIVRPVKEKMDLIQSSAFDESMGSLDHLGISSSWNSY